MFAPVAAELTLAIITMVVVVLGAIEGIVPVNACPLMVPKSVVPIFAETNVRPAGKVSATATLVAALGPLLFTVIVYVTA